MWCCFEPAPRRVFLSSAKLPTFGAAADDAARAAGG